MNQPTLFDFDGQLQPAPSGRRKGYNPADEAATAPPIEHLGPTRQPPCSPKLIQQSNAGLVAASAPPQHGAEAAGPRSVAARIVALAQQGALTDAEKGELNTLLDRHLKTNSPALLAKLYDPPPDGWGFPRRFIKEGAKNTDRLSRSTDALLATFRQTRDKRLELCLRLSDRLTQLKTLRCKLDKDGRLRMSINIAGTEVGRVSCGASNTGSGYALHSTPERHRHLFLADPGHDFYQVDLAGADTWTVAAECLALGDPTMWDDLLAGLKPAKALSALYLDGESANRLPREALLARCKTLPKDWLYDTSKKACHGSNYGEGDVKMAETVLRDSWEAGEGTLATVTAAQCKRLQNLYFLRYPGVRRWQERTKMLLQRDGFLIAASGLKRDFFGNKQDLKTIKDALPFCPAANTAYCCNLALLKLWNDPQNLCPDGKRVARPLLTVHDSVLFQAPHDRRDWVRERIPVWFANPITVAGTTFTIPFEAMTGPSWGELSPL